MIAIDVLEVDEAREPEIRRASESTEDLVRDEVVTAAVDEGGDQNGVAGGVSEGFERNVDLDAGEDAATIIDSITPDHPQHVRVVDRRDDAVLREQRAVRARPAGTREPGGRRVTATGEQLGVVEVGVVARLPALLGGGSRTAGEGDPVVGGETRVEGETGLDLSGVGILETSHRVQRVEIDAGVVSENGILPLVGDRIDEDLELVVVALEVAGDHQMEHAVRDVSEGGVHLGTVREVDRAEVGVTESGRGVLDHERLPVDGIGEAVARLTVGGREDRGGGDRRKSEDRVSHLSLLLAEGDMRLDLRLKPDSHVRVVQR